MRHLLALFALLCGTHMAMAQHQGHSPGMSAAPYSGLEKREIKALSETEIADLRMGKGMGMALPAELNGYPGPAHILELADKLKLTENQRAFFSKQVADMKSESIAFGDKLIEEERTLDTLFTSGSADESGLERAVMHASHAHALVRMTHLKYHLSTKAALTPEQVAAYSVLRGYHSSPPAK